MGSVPCCQSAEILGAVSGTETGHGEGCVLSFDEQTLVCRGIVVPAILFEVEVQLFIGKERHISLSEHKFEFFHAAHDFASFTSSGVPE